MIDAFRKDFSRLQRGRLTDRRTDGRNSAGIDSALKRFLFFESTRTRGEEVIKNLSRIWRPFFFIGVLHFPRCTTIFHRWYRFPTPSLLHFSHRYFLPRFLYPSIFSLLSARASFFLSPVETFQDQASLKNFPETSLISFPNVFPFTKKTRLVADQKGNWERWQ